MKIMTCKQLGGACDTVFLAETFDEIDEVRKNHSIEMLMKRDKSHLLAMNNMIKFMESTKARKDWYNAKKEEFDSLPEYDNQCGCGSCSCQS